MAEMTKQIVMRADPSSSLGDSSSSSGPLATVALLLARLRLRLRLRLRHALRWKISRR